MSDLSLPPGGANPFSTVPLFGRDQGPQATGPFNFNNSPMLSLGGMLLSQSVMSRYGAMPFQFFPQQSVYDQMLAQRLFAEQQKALALAATRDTRAMERLVGGGIAMYTGQPLTPAQRQQAAITGGQIAGFTPLMTQLLGTRLVDELYGETGSATAMAAAVDRAGRTLRDPVSGAIGLSGNTTGAVVREMFANLYEGRGRPDMKGIRAGQAGEMFEELSYLGLAGPLGAQETLFERMRSAAALELDDGRLTRLAEGTKLVRDARAENRDPTAAEMSEAKRQVQATQAAIRGADPLSAPDAAAFLNLPGADELLRAGDAGRISSRLKNMSGAVAAMREIFGDMGNPNAPMRELLNGLDALTQGGLATMSPAALEKTVRMTQAVARQSGVGMQAFLGLNAQNAAMADQLGLNRGAATIATQAAVAFGAAAKETMRLDMPAYGSLTLEEATLLENQLMMTAQDSPMANQLNTTLRMADSGLLAEGTEAAQLAKAIKEQRTTYEFGGKTKNVAMAGAAWREMLSRSGIDAATAQQLYADTYGNQEYGEKYRTGELARQLQLEVDILPMLAEAASTAILPELSSTAATTRLKNAGLSDDSVAGITRKASETAARKLAALPPEVSRDRAKLNAALTNISRESIQTAVQAAGVDAGLGEDAAIALAQDLVTKDITSADMRQAGQRLEAGVGSLITRNPATAAYRSLQGLLQMQGTGSKVLERRSARLREAEATAAMTAAMAGLGTAGPLGRITDALRNADSRTPLSRVITDVVGGVSATTLLENSEQAKAMFGQRERFDAAERDDRGGLTAAGAMTQKDAADNVAALVAGGEKADARLQALWAARGGAPEKSADYLTTLNAQLSSATDAKKRAALEAERQLVVGLMAARADEGGLASLMRTAGFVTDTTIEPAMVAIAADKGATFDHGKDSKSKTAAANAFITATHNMTEAFRFSPADIAQLGAGETDLIGGIEGSLAKLRTMAEDANVTEGELLAGTGGVSTDAHAAALTERDVILKHLNEIKKIKASGLAPGAAGRDDGRVPLTDSMRKLLDAEADFRRPAAGVSSMEELQQDQIDAVSKQLAAQAGDAYDPAEIERALAASGNAPSLFRSLSAQDMLLQKIEDVAGKGAISKLPPSERRRAIDTFLATRGTDELRQLRLEADTGLGIVDQRTALDAAAASRRPLAADAGDSTTSKDKGKTDVTMHGTLRLEGLESVILQGIGTTAGELAFGNVV